MLFRVTFSLRFIIKRVFWAVWCDLIVLVLVHEQSQWQIQKDACYYQSCDKLR